MESVEPKPTVKAKKRKRRKTTWQKILTNDYELGRLQLFNDTLASRMFQEAFILERFFNTFLVWLRRCL